MGSHITLNDTLQITREQGFPEGLDIELYLKDPASFGSFVGREFEFKKKSGIRVYHAPPVRVFLVQNIGGKWLYWGLAHILEVNHHMKENFTSGRFKIIKLYSPEEMRTAYRLVDGTQPNYFE